jgi:uncharacterized Fe-S cluster-containing radical SAM superfamily protein
MKQLENDQEKNKQKIKELQSNIVVSNNVIDSLRKRLINPFNANSIQLILSKDEMKKLLMIMVERNYAIETNKLFEEQIKLGDEIISLQDSLIKSITKSYKQLN